MERRYQPGHNAAFTGHTHTLTHNALTQREEENGYKSFHEND